MAVQTSPGNGRRVGEGSGGINGGGSTRGWGVMTEPRLRHIAGSRYVDVHSAAILGDGFIESLAQRDPAMIDRLRHGEWLAEADDDSYGSWTPEQRRLLREGQFRLDEHDRPLSGDCD